MVHLQSGVPTDDLSPERSSLTGRRTKVRWAPESIEVGLAALGSEPMIRLGPLNSRHVLLLTEVPDRWPPILVARRTMSVLDGVHRVAAARRLGMTCIQARLFEGDEEAAFVEAVRSNMAHGLPLSLAERTSAARHLLTTSPERSDRSIAEICGLSHRTVGRLRGQLGRPTGDTRQSGTRIGRDLRSRPLDAAGVRARIVVAVAESPGDTLRQIARRVGASPETVRDVRARLARGEDPIPVGAAKTASDPRPGCVPAPRPAWARDTACRSARDAAEFAAWFDRGAASLDWPRFVDAVPLSRVYEIADQARAYAEAWRSFAEVLERRTRPGISVPLP